MLRSRCATDSAVVLRAAIGRTDDQRLPQTVAQHLKLVERGLVDQQLAGAPAGDFGGLKFGQRQAPSGTAKIGFANMGDYMRPGVDGDPVLDFSELSREQKAALAEVTVEDIKANRGKGGDDSRDIRRVKFKLYDKRAALVDLGKHLGVFAERHEHTGKDGGPIETVSRVERVIIDNSSDQDGAGVQPAPEPSSI